MSATPEWQRARKLLCVRLDNMGDVLMTTPALQALKRQAAHRHLTLLASASGSSVVPFVPDIDSVLTFDAPWVKNDCDDMGSACDMLDVLKHQAFDAAIIFTVYSQSALPAALLCRLAGIPLVLAHCRENPYHLLSHWVRESEPARYRHEVQRQLDLVATIGAVNPDPVLRFVTRTRDRLSLYRKLRDMDPGSGKPWIVAHCGASAESRRYPAAMFARAFRSLGRDAAVILLTGDSAERGLSARIRQWCATRATVVDLAGMLTLGELGCLIEDAAVLVSNNTGPVHIAAATGTPVVDLYALTNPQHTPWKVPRRVLFHDVPCKYCYRSVCPETHHRCLRGVAPDDVCRAIRDLLAVRDGHAGTACRTRGATAEFIQEMPC